MYTLIRKTVSEMLLTSTVNSVELEKETCACMIVILLEMSSPSLFLLKVYLYHNFDSQTCFKFLLAVQNH